MKHSPLKIAVLSFASTGLIITGLVNSAPAWSKVSSHAGFDAGESRSKLASISSPTELTHTRLVNAAPETRNRLVQIEQQRKKLHEQAMQIRQKEKEALKQLNKIETKLNTTTGVLNEHKHELKKTESTMNEVQVRLTETKTNEQDMSQQAGTRLREIYEGQRLSLVEMLFQVDSLQSFLDKWYYQERVAELDKKVLQDLRLKAQTLAQNKEKLGEKADKLGDIVSEFAKKAMAIAKEKFDQEQVASRLRTQRAFYEQAEQQLASESHNLETQILRMESSRHSNKPMTQGSGNLAYPISAQVTSPFGWRRHPIFGVRRFHTGVDLAGPNHSAIRAADSGNVLYTGWYGGYGKVVIVSHGKGMATLYAHMSKIATNAGDNVSKGDVVGYEGTTGFSTGPHLHFEVRYNGIPNNPLNYLH